MAKTIIGLFHNQSEVRKMLEELSKRGYSRDNISVVASDSRGELTERDGSGAENTARGAAAGAGTGAVLGGIGGLVVGLGSLMIPGIGPIVAAGPLATALAGAGVGAAAGGLVGALTNIGVSDEEAGYYAEGVRRGGTLVMVDTDDNHVDEVVSMMNRFGAVDIEQEATQWRSQGWSGFDANAGPYTATDSDRGRATHRGTESGETRIPIVEEDLQVGKRRTENQVHIESHVTERPVDEQVRLRQEHVSVERRPTDRDANEQDLATFRDGSIDISESREEAVVNKRARVVEEVVVRKDVDEHVENIRDTVRRTDVEVTRDSDEGRRSGTMRDDRNRDR